MNGSIQCTFCHTFLRLRSSKIMLLKVLKLLKYLWEKLLISIFKKMCKEYEHDFQNHFLKNDIPL